MQSHKSQVGTTMLLGVEILYFVWPTLVTMLQYLVVVVFSATSWTSLKILLGKQSQHDDCYGIQNIIPQCVVLEFILLVVL